MQTIYSVLNDASMNICSIKRELLIIQDAGCSPFRDTFGIILGIALLSIFASKQTSMASSPRECQRSAQNLISKLLNGSQWAEHRKGGVYFANIAEFCGIVECVEKFARKAICKTKLVNHKPSLKANCFICIIDWNSHVKAILLIIKFRFATWIIIAFWSHYIIILLLLRKFNVFIICRHVSLL